MAQSTTRVATAHGQRYLTQLCKHWGHKFAVTHGDGRGEIPFGEDRFCRLSADADGLDITVEAPADTLLRLQDVVFDHLKRFAFREELGEPVWTVSA